MFILQRGPYREWRCVHFITTKDDEVCFGYSIRLTNGDIVSVLWLLQWFGCYLLSVNGQLEQLEKEHNISSRWKPDDKDYEELLTHLLKEKMLQVRTALWSSVVKRHYLLRMKAKYAGNSISFYEGPILFMYHFLSQMGKK